MLSPVFSPGWVLLQCLRWMVAFGDGPEIFRRDSNPGSNRGWPIIRNVTHIHGSCSALQNTYISCLGHDDASSVSFDWANACAVLPRPVSGASRVGFCADVYLGQVQEPCICVTFRIMGQPRFELGFESRRYISGPSPNVTIHRRHCSSTHPGVTAQ